MGWVGFMKNTMDTNRNIFIDVIKAIGIISIVIGHSSWRLPEFSNFPIGPFVYTYHLMIFLFVAGFCFKREYAQNLELYIGKRIISLSSFFVVYSIIFIVLHNVFIKLGLIEGNAISEISEFLTRIAQVFTLNISENLLGAFWFVPLLLFAYIFFGLLYSLAERLPYSLLWHILFVIFCGCVGIYACVHQLQWKYRIEISILGIPIMYIGYIFKIYWSELQRIFHLGGSIVCAFILCYILQKATPIELSINSIMSPILFYPVTMLGITFCIGVARTIEESWLSGIVGYIGRNSFHIMALHFLAFKIVDVIYGKLYHIDAAVVKTFPHAFGI